MEYNWENLTVKTVVKDENNEYWGELNIDDDYSCSCYVGSDGKVKSLYINEKTQGSVLESLKEIPEKLQEIITCEITKINSTASTPCED